jgi:hypothetical protein
MTADLHDLCTSGKDPARSERFLRVEEVDGIPTRITSRKTPGLLHNLVGAVRV